MVRSKIKLRKLRSWLSYSIPRKMRTLCEVGVELVVKYEIPESAEAIGTFQNLQKMRNLRRGELQNIIS